MSDEELKALLDAFRQKLALDPEIRAAEKKIADGKADFSDTSRMFWRRSELLGDYMQGIVLDLAPEDRERLAEALLRMGYNDTNGVLVPLQEALDEPLGVHLTPVVPKYPAERVTTVAHALMDPTVPEEKIVRRAGAPVANVNMSFHDKYMEENARIRARLGMKPTITRYGSGCCKWCSEVAGRYRFGEQPKDIFRRHDNCGCTIIYDNQVLRGRQNEGGGRSRAWEEVDPAEVERQANEPVQFSEEEADQINLLGKLKSLFSGQPYQERVTEFAEQLPNIQNRNVAKLLRKALGNVSFAQSTNRQSSYRKGKVYLSKSATPSTIAHELFHRIDTEYKVTKRGLLDDCLISDYEHLENLAESTGQTLEDVLYLKYQDAFSRPGKLKPEYRGISDIIEGMTNGGTRLGYGHIASNPDYWQKTGALSRETFAQYGRMYFEENPAVLDMLKELFPDTTAQIDTIIPDIV